MFNTAPSTGSGIWSYSPFVSQPRRRSLPHAKNTDPWDPFEKPDRQSQSKTLPAVFMTQSRQSRWLKAGGVISVILLLYYFLSGQRVVNVNNKYTTADSPTTKCTKPHDLSKPLVQYAIMIDAGSTGSRIHVYKFNNCGPTPELEKEDFEMTKVREGGSGLSAYKSDPEAAAMSLDPLMEVAMRSVPDEYKACTPIAVKATAGLRLLGNEASLKILEAVRIRLETVYPFAVISEEKGGVEIMGGDQEGIYAWITTNYLLGTIVSPDKTPTAAIFDLGGGSTQIVFQPTFPHAAHGGMPAKMADGDHKYNLKFGGRTFELYQHSHLGYGLMSARESIHRHLLEQLYEKNQKSTAFLDEPIPNPCLARGTKRTIKVKFPDNHPLGSSREVTMQGSSGLPAQCRALAEAILYKDKDCQLAPCSFNGIHQPSLQKTFSREDLYIFSYFYDRTHDLGMPESFTLREMHELTDKVCGGEASWRPFEIFKDAIDELKGRPEWCLDLNFMLALLHTGYELPIDREVKIAKKINGNELGWCLGASLPLLEKESGWQCRVKQVA